MAEIKIEKKKPIWPWIIALLLIGGIVYYVFLRDNHSEGESEMKIENSTSIDSTQTDSTQTDTTQIN